MKKTEDYQEGWNDCAKVYEKTHVALNELTETFDKFFDKINAYKKITIFIHNHFKSNIDYQGNIIDTEEKRKENLEAILQMVDYMLKKGQNNDTK